MSRYVAPKWRPPLMLVLGGSLLAILVLPIYAALIADILTPLTGRRNAVFIVAAGSLRSVSPRSRLSPEPQSSR